MIPLKRYYTATQESIVDAIESKGIIHRSAKNQRDFRPYSTEWGDEWPSFFNPTMFDWMSGGTRHCSVSQVGIAWNFL